METAGDRAARLFGKAIEAEQHQIKAVLADHSAKGLLKSGVTIKRSVAAYEETTSAALAEALAGIAKRTDKRGWKWKDMIAEVEGRLEQHMSDGPARLKKTLLLAHENGLALAEPLFAKANRNLRNQIHEYREGWSAPAGKAWIERHPVVYALLSALVGAALSQAVEKGFDIASRHGGDQVAKSAAERPLPQQSTSPQQK